MKIQTSINNLRMIYMLIDKFKRKKREKNILWINFQKLFPHIRLTCKQ